MAANDTADLLSRAPLRRSMNVDAAGNYVAPGGGSGSGLTDAQLRASAVPVSVAGVATQTTLAAVLAKLITNPSTDTLQTAGNTILTNIKAALDTANATLTTMSTALAGILTFQAAQATVTYTAIPVTANTPFALVAASSTRQGMRVVNYLTSPIYYFKGTSGTPSAANADFCPALATSIPGQAETPYRPVDAHWATSAASGTIIVVTW